jgi:hypothetical protein
MGTLRPDSTHLFQPYPMCRLKVQKPAINSRLLLSPSGQPLGSGGFALSLGLVAEPCGTSLEELRFEVFHQRASDPSRRLESLTKMAVSPSG